MSKPWFYIFSIALLFSLMSFLRKMTPRQTIEKEVNNQSDLSTAQKNGLTKLLYAQATHESGKFASQVFKDNNNMFGMKQSSRPYDTGTLHGHATFASLSDNVKDIIGYLRQSASYKLFQIATMTPLQYASFLKSRGYFEDTLVNYQNALQRYYA